MKPIHYFTVLLPFLLLLTACTDKKDVRASIYVENKLDKAVYVIPYFEYPDTNIGKEVNKKRLQNTPRLKYAPQSGGFLGLFGFCHEEVWKNYIPSDTLLIIVLDKELADKEDWEEYASGKKYLRKYTYSHEDIVNNGCQIIIE